MSERRLELRDLSLALGQRRLVAGLSVAVEPGQVTTIMGASGCGKSSLLAYLCGTLDPAFRAGGTVLLDGRDLTLLAPEARRLGILFQDDLLFPHLTVGENLAFALPRGGGRRARRERVDAALAAADLKGFAERDPATLSGGQRARVALLRTLMAEPRALLLDEPFAKLDAGLKARFRATVFAHAIERDLPTLLVTHDPADAAAAGGPVIEIGAGGDATPEDASQTAPPLGQAVRLPAAG